MTITNDYDFYAVFSVMSHLLWEQHQRTKEQQQKHTEQTNKKGCFCSESSGADCHKKKDIMDHPKQ